MAAGAMRVVALTMLVACACAARADASFFGASGPWNAALPSAPALDANSAPIVTAMSQRISAAEQRGAPPSINTTSYSTPVWPASGTRRRLVYDNDPNTSMAKAIAALNAAGGLPIPAGAQPGAGTDGQIVIYDGTARTLYEFWRASTPRMNALTCLAPLPWGEPCHHDGKWHAVYGGLMDDVGSDPGFFSPAAWPTAGTSGWHWGARATSLPLLGGLITFDDLRSGTIDHAVAAGFTTVCRSYFVAPAQRDDGTDTSASCLPEGTRLQLDPAYDVSHDAS